MSLRLRLSAPARKDLDRLPDFLEINSPRTAARVRALLAQALSSLLEFPERGRASGDAGHRELPVRFGHSAYIIRYRVRLAEVLVTRIRHARESR